MQQKSKSTITTTATTLNPFRTAAKRVGQAFSPNTNTSMTRPATSERTLAVLAATEESWPSCATLAEYYPTEYFAQDALHLEVPIYRSQEADLDMIDFEDRAWGSPPSTTGKGWISSLFRTRGRRATSLNQ
ncbi:hypothetical protein LshimejAT787_1401960 [Lyophyllum shimeji]|uniref:Uncharacterized protein n=1 Tax=Lyophyllum shimeji TaxID=47721 RepID=A0A9P3PY26_LYOSH|nr:hypothetical protein LshimejAT787_1401960 [Lyophyllum shimeji]